MLDPEIKAMIDKVNEKIYTTFSEEEIEEAIEKKFASDGDIKHNRKELKE